MKTFNKYLKYSYLLLSFTKYLSLMACVDGIVSVVRWTLTLIIGSVINWPLGLFLSHLQFVYLLFFPFDPLISTFFFILTSELQNSKKISFFFLYFLVEKGNTKKIKIIKNRILEVWERNSPLL